MFCFMHFQTRVEQSIEAAIEHRLSKLSGVTVTRHSYPVDLRPVSFADDCTQPYSQDLAQYTLDYEVFAPNTQPCKYLHTVSQSIESQDDYFAVFSVGTLSIDRICTHMMHLSGLQEECSLPGITLHPQADGRTLACMSTSDFVHRARTPQHNSAATKSPVETLRVLPSQPETDLAVDDEDQQSSSHSHTSLLWLAIAAVCLCVIVLIVFFAYRYSMAKGNIQRTPQSTSV